MDEDEDGAVFALRRRERSPNSNDRNRTPSLTPVMSPATPGYLNQFSSQSYQSTASSVNSTESPPISSGSFFVGARTPLSSQAPRSLGRIRGAVVEPELGARRILPITNQTLCFGDLLESWQPVKKTETASEALLVFGKLKPNVLPDVASRDVVVKIAPTTLDPERNGLQVERDLYMVMHDTVIHWTPHVLQGLFEGHCSDQVILDMEGKTTKPEATLNEQWVSLRRKALLHALPEEQYILLGQRLQRQLGRNDVDEEDFFDAYDLFKLDYPIEMSFIVTPRLFDATLNNFFTQGVHTLSEPKPTERDILQIAAQVAQCLAVFEKEEIMHHDLHTGNVFLRRLPEKQQIVYKYPKREGVEQKLTTGFFATLYDFDHGTGRGFDNTTITHEFCITIGECNGFVKNFDWYTFLTYYILTLQMGGFKVPGLLRKALVGNDPSQDAFTGRPCTCINGAPNACKVCMLKRQFLYNMMSPTAFFNQVVALHNG